MMIVGVLPVNESIAHSQCIGVLYPESPMPYEAIFKQIISGISSGSDSEVKRIEMPRNNPAGRDVVTTNECDDWIALGKAAFDVLSRSKKNFVAGALALTPESIDNVAAISIIPDPAELFVRLKYFKPEIKNVVVVIGEKSNDGLIQRARRSLTESDMKLDVYYVKDEKDAYQVYKDLINTVRWEKAAIWVPPDRISANETMINRFVIEQAWEKRVTLFSSQTSFVKTGALFSVMPDNSKLGTSLRLLLEKTRTNNNARKIQLLADLYTAVNRNTAVHLDIDLSQKTKFIDTIFPQD